MYHFYSSMLIAKKLAQNEERIDRLFLGVSTPLSIMANRFVLFLPRRLDRRPALTWSCCCLSSEHHESSDIFRASFRAAKDAVDSERLAVDVTEEPTRACRRTYEPLLVFFRAGSDALSWHSCCGVDVVIVLCWY